METLRPLARLYIAGLALLAALLGAVAIASSGGLPTQRMFIALALAAYMVVALLFPLPFAPKTNMTLDTGVIFAGVLLLPPSANILIVGLGTLAASVVRKRPPVAMLFNSAQRVLQAAAGGLLLAAVDWNVTQLQFETFEHGLGIAAAAAAMYAINTLSVATVVALQSGESPISVWRRSSWSVGGEYVSQLALGLMAAAVADPHVWALPLLLLPAFAIYRSLQRHQQLRASAAEALRSTEASLAAAQRIAHLGSWNRDLVGEQEIWSDEVYRIFGYAPQQFPPSFDAFLRAVHPDDCELVERALHEAIHEGKQYSATHRIVRPDGSKRWIHQQAEVIADASGAPVRMLGTVHDITERKRAEEERDALLAEVEQALEFRNQFLSITSHELKTPITLLKGYAQVLHDRLGRRDEPELMRPLQIINRQADRMTALINELLDVSRIQSGSLRFETEPLELREAVEEVVAEVGEGTNGATLRLQAEVGPLWVQGDRMRLQQVISNLLTNAVKYSPDRKEVDVALRREGQRALISVRDYGIGIPEEQRAHVFELYFRAANAHTANAGGLGLGLYISKMIVERHGGTIELESEEGEGSTFSVRLPLLHQAPPTPSGTGRASDAHPAHAAS